MLVMIAKAYAFKVSDVYFARTLGVIISTLFYCLHDLSCGDCNLISLYFMCCSVNGCVCLVFCVTSRLYELFGIL